VARRRRAARPRARRRTGPRTRPRARRRRTAAAVDFVIRDCGV
jgi:hypothetical protein